MKAQPTSKEAFKNLRDSGKLNKQQQQVLEFFMEPFKYGGIIGYNYHEVIKYTGIKSAQKRLNEIERKGLIKKVGVSEGCSTYQYVPDPKEQEALRQKFANKKSELEEFVEFLSDFERLKGKWYLKTKEVSPKDLIQKFKLRDQIIY